MTQFLEQLYSKHAYNYVLAGEPSLDPEDYRKKSTLERDVDNAKDYLKQVLYWLYEAPNFDEIAFERCLEEHCAFLGMSIPPQALKRKVS